MEIKSFLFLLVIISTIIIIYWTLGFLNQVDPEINLSPDIWGVSSDNIYHEMVKTKCGNCNGKGVIECPQCKGSGETVNSTDCKACDGSGKIYKDHNISKCMDCDDGKIVNKSMCLACNGPGHIKCYICRGDGIIQS